MNDRWEERQVGGAAGGRAEAKVKIRRRRRVVI